MKALYYVGELRARGVQEMNVEKINGRAKLAREGCAPIASKTLQNLNSTNPVNYFDTLPPVVLALSPL